MPQAIADPRESPISARAVAQAVLPEWTAPEQASVFDPWYRPPIRTALEAIKWLGLDDPTRLMEMATAMPTGPTRAALDVIAEKFPQ